MWKMCKKYKITEFIFVKNIVDFNGEKLWKKLEKIDFLHKEKKECAPKKSTC